MEAENPLSADFWDYLDRLVAKSELVIEQPRGSAHPHLPEVIYPLDYGSLKDTPAGNSRGMAVWLGSLFDRSLDAVMLTVDPQKRASSLTLMLGCTPDEKQTAQAFTNRGEMRAVLVPRGGELAWLRTRRSVRKFLPRPVPDEVLRQVLETATWAPSAHNRQPWRFAILKTQSGRQHLADALSTAYRSQLIRDGIDPEQVEQKVFLSHWRITSAPAAVLVCLDPHQGDAYPDPFRQQAELVMGVQGTAMAGCTLLLAAHAVGLAGVWLCAPLFAPQAARQALDLPPAWQPQALVLLGYPENTPPPPERLPLEEVSILL